MDQLILIPKLKNNINCGDQVRFILNKNKKKKKKNFTLVSQNQRVGLGVCNYKNEITFIIKTVLIEFFAKNKINFKYI